MAQEMSPEARRRFLMAGTRTAKLATAGPDGRPHVAPVWFVLDGDDLIFMTGAATVKGRRLLHDPRVALCVDDEAPPFAFVVLEGTAQVSEAAADLLAWSTRIARRYMGEEQATAYGRRNAVPGELLVRVTPTRIVAQSDVSA